MFGCGPSSEELAQLRLLSVIREEGRKTRKVLRSIRRAQKLQLHSSMLELEYLRKLTAYVKCLRTLFCRPFPISVVSVGEKPQGAGMPDRILFDVKLPSLPSDPHDIESVEVSVTYEDGGVQSVVVPADSLVATGFEANQDSFVRVEATNIDDAGNRSLVTTLDVQIKDTIVPAPPGDLGIVVVGERHD